MHAEQTSLSRVHNIASLATADMADFYFLHFLFYSIAIPSPLIIILILFIFLRFFGARFLRFSRVLSGSES
jgi:hypothetical protein